MHILRFDCSMASQVKISQLLPYLKGSVRGQITKIRYSRSDKRMEPTSIFIQQLESKDLTKKPFFNYNLGVTSKSYYDSQKLVASALFNRIRKIDINTCQEKDIAPFYVCDLGELKRLAVKLRKCLPRIHPFYAVKCNNDSRLLRAIANLGFGFDCASKEEIDQIISENISPSRIIYANPCKSIPHLRHAKNVRVALTTVDNLDELVKINKFHPSCGILIRILTDDSSSTCPLSVKFGASLKYAREMIDACKSLDLDLKGIAFHVGSGCNNFNTFAKAVQDSRELFNYAERQGFKMNILDVGGGFAKSSLEQSSIILRNALDSFFPEAENPELIIISEMGRYFSSSCFTLAANIISKRSDPQKERLYLNDGVYGNLNCILYDHQLVQPKVLTSGGQFKYFDNLGTKENHVNSQKTYSIWGPTCDGLDCIISRIKLPYEVEIGDWLYFENAGAYTSVAATSFNGFKSNFTCIYVNSEY